MKNVKNLPTYLAAINKKNNRVFVLAQPSLSAIKIDGTWQYRQPLSDDEIKEYELVTDLRIALEMVNEAKKALKIK